MPVAEGQQSKRFARGFTGSESDDGTEREFWQAAYLEAIRVGEDINLRAETADIALMHFRQRRADAEGPRP